MHPIRSSLDSSQPLWGDPFVGAHDSYQPDPELPPSAAGFNPATPVQASTGARAAIEVVSGQTEFLADSQTQLVRPAVEVIGVSESRSGLTEEMSRSAPARGDDSFESPQPRDEWLPEPDGPALDVRDFLNPDAVPQPIEAILPHLPSGLDEFTAQQLALADAELKAHPPATATEPGQPVLHPEPALNPSIDLADRVPTRVVPGQVIYALSDQVICLDGEQGIDLIDLQCFTIGQASFEPSLILIDDTERQATYRIEYQNIERAIFANQVEVHLE